MADTLSRFYSGIIINQNAAPEEAADFLGLATPVYQQFRLPGDHARGTRSPAITGVQVRVGVSQIDARVTVRVEHKPFFGDWALLAEGVAQTPAAVDEEVWLTCLFDAPIAVAGLEEDDFRFHLSDAQGVTKAWYTVPNPLAATGGPKALAEDGTTPLLDAGREFSLGFRLLGAVADTGIDFLGNQYRSAVIRKSVGDTDPLSPQDAYWLSEPQPSKFAVVSQYWDMSDVADPVVIDGVLIDPVTPGMYVHAYYSSDGEPGASEEEWEERVWTPVPRAYHALRRDAFVFPEPIKARYVKLEYSHLQARSYPAGSFQKPIEYRKHPKWVLDYFLLAAQDANNVAEDQFIVRNVTVNYDAYTLAFTYFQDDLGTDVKPPPYLSAQDQARVEQFIGTRDDKSDKVDSATRAQINTIMQPYLYDARTRTLARSLIGDAMVFDGTPSGYPVEAIPAPGSVSSAVSTLNREGVVLEQSFPVMYFYLPSRHRYRHVTATLPNDRAYFAGVREVAFTRERYHVESDATMYTETLGDHFNSERNDFVGPTLPVPPPPPAPVPEPTP